MTRDVRGTKRLRGCVQVSWNENAKWTGEPSPHRLLPPRTCTAREPCEAQLTAVPWGGAGGNSVFLERTPVFSGTGFAHLERNMTTLDDVMAAHSSKRGTTSSPLRAALHAVRHDTEPHETAAYSFLKIDAQGAYWA